MRWRDFSLGERAAEGAIETRLLNALVELAAKRCLSILKVNDRLESEADFFRAFSAGRFFCIDT
jgi:hypothetical protein